MTSGISSRKGAKIAKKNEPIVIVRISSDSQRRIYPNADNHYFWQ
jgi:hypothetical protein